jgi:hypothetical protein
VDTLSLYPPYMKSDITVVSGMELRCFPETHNSCFGNGADFPKPTTVVSGMERISRNPQQLFREWSGFPETHNGNE